MLGCWLRMTKIWLCFRTLSQLKKSQEKGPKISFNWVPANKYRYIKEHLVMCKIYCCDFDRIKIVGHLFCQKGIKIWSSMLCYGYEFLPHEPCELCAINQKTLCVYVSLYAFSGGRRGFQQSGGGAGSNHVLVGGVGQVDSMYSYLWRRSDDTGETLPQTKVSQPCILGSKCLQNHMQHLLILWECRVYKGHMMIEAGPKCINMKVCTLKLP